MKIFADEDYDDSVRRTPRRVRFGGEVVKLRTPDSDSNNTNDEPPIKIETKPKPKLSQIPVRKASTSLPTSPAKGLGKRTQKSYQSSPELRQKTSKIPLRRSCSRSEVRNRITITFKEWSANEVVGGEKKGVADDGKKLKVPVCTKKSCRSDEFGGKVPLHNEVEILHNLTRSPEPKSVVKNEEEQKAADKKEDVHQEAPRQLVYNSFQVCPESKTELKANSSEIGLVPSQVVDDLQNKVIIFYYIF